MPISKQTRSRRISEGKCSLCENTAAPLLADPTRKAKYCRQHLKYFSDYRKTWQTENRPEPSKLKCAVCRKTGHNRNDCPDPRAAQYNTRAVKPN